MDSENTILKSKKIKIYPTLEQKKILKQFIGAYRYFYNKTINYINNIKTEKSYIKVKKGDGNYILYNNEYLYVEKFGNYKLKYSFIPQYIKNKNGKEIRVNQTSLITLRPIIKKDKPEWSKIIPSHLIDYAIKEASQSFSDCMSALKKLNRKFNLQYKSKKNSIKETIHIEKCYFSKNLNTIFKKLLGPHIKSSEDFRNIKKKDSSLTYNRKLDEWYLNINYEDKTYNMHNNNKIKDVALDQGEKIFMVAYSPNRVYKIGTDASDKLYKKAKEVDIILSKISKVKNNKEKKSLKRAFYKKIKKIKNMRDDLHWKVINFLTERYNRIILPIFNTSRMVKTLNHLVSRKIYTLSFFKFKERMIYKCKERNINLLIGTEEYTTKTCTNCGKLNNVSGRIYKCKNCNLNINRDINGARNIYLKYL